MKTIHERQIMCCVPKDAVIRAMDLRAKTISVPCPCCGGQIYFDELMVTDRHLVVIEEMHKRYEDLIKSNHEAILEIYGHDVRMELFTKKLIALKEKFIKEFCFTVIEGGEK